MPHQRFRKGNTRDSYHFSELDFDASYVGANPDMSVSVSEEPMEVESGWAELRAKLTGHYAVASAKDLIKWIF